MRYKLSAGILLHGILFAGPSSAATIHVDGSNPNCPGDGSSASPFCLIQDAITAASIGDTVLVVAGTYVENLDFLGKPITVTGVSGPAVTLIQAGAPGSVVRFDSGESINSVLQGFTISGGSGTVVSWGAGTAPVGGGIFCRLSSPTIRDNVIENNSGALHGGGIFCEGGAPTIEGNVIRGHNTESGGGIALRLSCGALIEANEIIGNTAGAACGGGILVLSESSPKIRNNTLSGNTGTCGGGIASEDATPLIHDNLITNNLADDGEGGGISCRSSTADIWRNEITGNRAVDGGGGIAFWNGDVTVAENLIQGNLASSSGNGGGLLGTVALAVIRDNFVVANDTRNIGGGMFLLGPARVLGNTVRGNLTRSGIVCFQGAPEIVDNLVLDNQGDGIECVGAGVSPTLRRNTIAGNQYGAVFVDLGASVSINSSILYGNGSNQVTIGGG